MRFIGHTLKHYRILEKLNEEGAGTICKVLDTQREVIQAITILKPDLVRNQAFLRRLGREAGNLTRLHHPNILAVHAFYDEPEHPFLVMDYVEGSSLAQLIKREGRLRYERALPLFRQLLQGLAYAHGQGFIHRDVNPARILITREGQVKITGFGLDGERNGQGVNLSAMSIEELHYLSPEHVRSRAEVDHRSDLYGVGMALYEALAGQTPFQEEDRPYIIMRAIVEEAFAPPTQLVPGIPEALAEIVMKALARKPEDRYQSAAEMQAALDAFQASAPPAPASEPERVVVASSPASSAPAPALARSGRTWVAYGVMGLALAVTVAVAWWALRDILAISTPELVPSSEVAASVTVQPGIYERILPSVGSVNGQGMLLLKAKPYGSISVGGSMLGEDSLEVVVRAGRRRLFFKHPAYGLRQRIVEVQPGQRKEVICYFEGFLRVQANDENGLPLQAELLVDNQRTGRQTPIEASYSLPPGVYMVEVFREGYLGNAVAVDVLPAADDSVLATPPIAPLTFVLQQVAER